MNRTSSVSLLSSLFKKPYSIGNAARDEQMEYSNQFYLSNQSLIDTSKNLANSKTSLVSSKLHLGSYSDMITKHVSIEKISKSDSNRDFNNSLEDGVPLENLPYLAVPSSKRMQYDMKENKRNEFTEKQHSFKRSKSWAKYHGSHLHNRSTRIHRRSRSDLGGLVINPLGESKTYIDAPEDNNYFRRFGAT